MLAMDPRDSYRLRITLADLQPPVWRRLLVPASLSLARLHRAIQAVFGWEDDHGHVFRIRGGEFGEAGTEDAFAFRGERSSLAGLGLQSGETFHYQYDFQDGWLHLVTVEERSILDAPVKLPRCLGGRRACPPEGSGGPDAFRERLKAAQDPSHPDHGEARAFFPTGWRPEAFLLRTANASLRAAFPGKG